MMEGIGGMEKAIYPSLTGPEASLKISGSRSPLRISLAINSFLKIFISL